MRMIFTAIAFATAIAITSSAHADTVTFDFDIESFGDSAETVIDFDFGLGDIESINSVSIELSHSWAPDIDFLLTSSDGFVFDLTSDNGDIDADLGDGTEFLSGVSTYTFVDPVNGFGTWTGLGSPIPEGTYDAETWSTSSFAAGTWNLFLADDAGADDGAVGSITVDFTAVPEPASALALLGLGGLVFARRRKQ